MNSWPVHGTITGPIVMIGFGSIGRGTLPLIEPLKNPLRLFHASIVARFALTARLMPMAESGSRQNIARIMRFACHSAVRIATDVLVRKGDET